MLKFGLIDLTVKAIVTDVRCNGGFGVVDVEISGGTPNYTLLVIENETINI
jgi:hypothetical protein